jgi:acyl-CoA hydrolase
MPSVNSPDQHLDDRSRAGAERAALDACVEATLSRVGNRIVLGLPVGIGKPNLLVNAFVQRAMADSKIQLTLFTALSLRAPKGRSDLERRFLGPFVKRVFGSYPELDYVRLLERRQLPSNIQINEFFLEPGGWLHDGHLQQHYLSSNYTHVARDLIRRGVNVIAQLVAQSDEEPGRLSLSCNPDLTIDLLPHIRTERARGAFALIGQVHSRLPFMYGDAVVDRNEFDFLIEDAADFPLFCPPNLPIGATDYQIALHVATLIRDGGTLQLGIGELGDAIVYALKLRHEHPEDFSALVETLRPSARQRALVELEGGVAPFSRGLYGCSEMLVDGFIDLYRAGILKRRVYPHALLQTVVDQGHGDQIDETLLDALQASGLQQLTGSDFEALQSAGVFRDDAHWTTAGIRTPQGLVKADLGDPNSRKSLVQYCLGSQLRHGVLVHGGFFFGPKAFYEALCNLPSAQRRAFAMQRISFVNDLIDDAEMKRAQRRDARFVNTTMMLTGLGAAVSDGLETGAVVSGVGGQYNFVAMAHSLPGARSLLCLRSTRTVKGRTTSNIVWNYGHVTIPRHLRDLVITEYGVADLRSRADGEVVAALVDVMDARFQDDFVAEAKRNGKLSADYRVPEAARANLPARLEEALAPWRERGLFGEVPFGTDFTPEELVIAKALKRLQAATGTLYGKAIVLAHALFASEPNASMQPFLERMKLLRPASFAERLTQRALVKALGEVLQKTG